MKLCKICTREKTFPIQDFPLTIMYSKPGTMVSTAPLHSHEFLEFVLVIGGYGIHQVKDQVSPIAQGDVLAIPELVKHCYTSDDQLCIYNILFSSDILGDTWRELAELPGIKALLKQQTILHLPQQKYQKLEQLVHSLLLEVNNRKKGFKIYSIALLIEFLMEIARHDFKASRNVSSELSEVRQNINDATFYISQNYKSVIFFDQLSRKVKMGRSSFFAKFKQLTGVSPMEYQMQYRIEKAKIMLRTTMAPIYQIAQQVGFNDTSYMIRQFKKYEKVTPAHYREILALKEVEKQ
ncbi:MAG: AraC family transcriptional regulator [Victivallaceae bacterium]|nr:AraC family transcriptional regulator [Victivallaceae bacterium]